MTRAAEPSNGWGMVFCVVFLLFWTTLTMAFNVMIAGSLGAQWATYQYAVVDGVMTGSAIEESIGTDRSTFRFRPQYRYRLGGEDFKGTQFRYGDAGQSSRKYLQRFEAEFPVGKTVSVYYLPGQPGESVLRRGFESLTVFLLLFMTPFNAITIGGWWGLWSYLRDSQRPVGGYNEWDDFGRSILRLNSTTPAGSALVTAGATALLAAIVVGLGVGFEPSWPVVGITWGVVVMAAIGFGIRTARFNASGAMDLVVDSAMETLELPLTAGRRQKETIALSSIKGMRQDRVIKTDSESNTVEYSPVLLVEERGVEREVRVITLGDAATSQKIENWLLERLSLPMPCEIEGDDNT